MKTPKRKHSRASFSLFGALLFFIPNLISVAFSVLVFDKLTKSGSSPAVIATVLLLTAAFLTVLYTVCDLIRRRVMIDKPVEEILKATDKIASGDFSVRLPSGRYDSDEFDHIKENLNVMTEALGRSEMLNSDFIANASHELKTPLAVIRSYATALQDPSLDETTRMQYAKTVENAASRLSKLATDILKLNKLENQKTLPEYGAFSLSEQLAAVAIDWEERMEQKGVALICDLPETEAYSCPDLLELVWNNLFSNAVKFTDAGGTVSLRLKVQGKNAVVTVSDTGKGIDPETGKHIFDKFYQGDSSHSSEGNGLGLALVKKVIDILGGEISVQSEPQKGASFTVLLKNVVL